MNFSKSVTMDVGFYDGQEIPIEAVEEYEQAVQLVHDFYNFMEFGKTVFYNDLQLMIEAKHFLEQIDVNSFLESKNAERQTKTQTDQAEEA